MYEHEHSRSKEIEINRLTAVVCARSRKALAEQPKNMKRNSPAMSPFLKQF